MNYITVDPFYNIDEYNRMINALKNNGVKYDELISIKEPHYWYIRLKETPLMIDYEKGNKSSNRFLLSKTRALRPRDEYLIRRRNTDAPQNFEKFVMNSVMNECIDNYVIVFRYKTDTKLREISRDLDIKIYPMGKYLNGRYNIAIGFNRYIKGKIDSSYVMLEKEPNELNKPGELEYRINHNVFMDMDHLIKYTETPFFENGVYKYSKIVY